MTPHHGDPWRSSRTTSLADTVNACDQTHHDIHSGKKTLRLKDGRWLNHNGWAEGPSRE
jgi:hypothetical protein